MLHQVAHQEDLDGQNDRNAVFELGVLGLVTPSAHTNPRTDAATHQGQSQQRLLGDAPGVLLGLPFIKAVDEEGGDIEHHEGIE